MRLCDIQAGGGVPLEVIKELSTINEFWKIDEAYEDVLKYVHPIMQRDVHAILKILQTRGVGAILFGSSITMRCSSFSDIDLAIITARYDEDLFMQVFREIKRSISYPADILYYNELDRESTIYHEVCKGVLLRRCDSV